MLADDLDEVVRCLRTKAGLAPDKAVAALTGAEKVTLILAVLELVRDRHDSNAKCIPDSANECIQRILAC